LRKPGKVVSFRNPRERHPEMYFQEYIRNKNDFFQEVLYFTYLVISSF
jgi:hypothetical protein